MIAFRFRFAFLLKQATDVIAYATGGKSKLHWKKVHATSQHTHENDDMLFFPCALLPKNT